jgi:hypothetical protein
MFPVFDVIFGTAWKPGKDEFPMTGLVPREKATGILDGIMWPVRQQTGCSKAEPISVTGRTKYCPAGAGSYWPS